MHNLFTYHWQSIETWLHEELFAIEVPDQYNSGFTWHILTSATLVDFPEFHNIHHLIPQFLDLSRDIRPIEHRDYYHQIEDPDKWEIYVKYRKIVSRFLINQRPIYQPPVNYGRPPLPYYCSNLFVVGQERYVDLAKYLLEFLSETLW